MTALLIQLKLKGCIYYYTQYFKYENDMVKGNNNNSHQNYHIQIKIFKYKSDSLHKLQKLAI